MRSSWRLVMRLPRPASAWAGPKSASNWEFWVSRANRVRGVRAAVFALAQVCVFFEGLFLALRLRVFLDLAVQELFLACRLLLELRVFQLLLALRPSCCLERGGDLHGDLVVLHRQVYLLRFLRKRLRELRQAASSHRKRSRKIIRS